MRLHSVKLINYKSIGELDHNEIIIEPNITAIIGKNESGKSNVLSGMSAISFFDKMQNIFTESNVNRNSDYGSEIKYIIVLKSLPGEDKCLQHDTTITITSDNFLATGGIFDYFAVKIKSDLDIFCEMLQNNLFKFPENFKHVLKDICSQFKVDKSLDIPIINTSLIKLKKLSIPVSEDLKGEYDHLLKVVNEKWNTLINLFPYIFYRNDEKQLKSEYRGDVIKNELKNKNSLLYELINYLGFTEEQILQMVSGKTDGRTQNLQDRIQQAIDNKINDPFHSFYTQEIVDLKVRFNTNAIAFSVRTKGGSTMTLGERSDGLRWYLNLFIDAYVHNVPSHNVVYIFDEPGISLHVNAQKEVLQLFSYLASKGNQIIYSTHSPYMLDIEKNGIERIRAIVKDKSENTKIYTTAYNLDIDSSFRKDTLAPLVQALGIGISDTFGPAFGKINIVTEGVSDCIYLNSIGKILGIDLSKYAFISAVGASNVINICTILYGWGCKFVALFDYDKEGVEKGGEIFRKKYEYVYKKHYIYLKDALESEIIEKSYKESKVEIEDLVPDLQEFLLKNNYKTDEGKVLRAKLYENALEEGTYTCTQNTLDNFKELFDRIMSCT